MREYLTADDIANEIRMSRTQFEGCFLLVEGVTDERVYRNFVNREGCEVVPAHNRDNATGALDILEKSHFSGAVAVVDADFSIIDGVRPESPNLLFTDSHDLETMILDSTALEKILNGYGSADKITRFTTAKGQDIRSYLFELAAHVGYLRWISLREELHLRFEDLSFDFINRDSLELDVPGMIRKVKNHSQKPQLNEAEMQTKIEQAKRLGHHARHICCGHDLVNVLSVALRRVLGTWDARDVKAEVLERSIRLAYDSSYFRNTELYGLIKNWEAANPPYQILSVAS